jgi:hypothetical protein
MRSDDLTFSLLALHEVGTQTTTGARREQVADGVVRISQDHLQAISRTIEGPSKGLVLLVAPNSTLRRGTHLGPW